MHKPESQRLKSTQKSIIFHFQDMPNKLRFDLRHG